VFRDPAVIDQFSSVSLDPNATGPARLETGNHQFGLLAGVVASIEYLPAWTRRPPVRAGSGSGCRWNRPRPTCDRLFAYLLASLRSLRGHGAGHPGRTHPGAQPGGRRRTRRP
jgi:hypothetical protein